MTVQIKSNQTVICACSQKFNNLDDYFEHVKQVAERRKENYNG